MRILLIQIVNRVGRALRAVFIPVNAPDSARVIESFISTGQWYGIDFGNSDPAWYRKP